MSRHDPLVRVRHMVDYAREAMEMAQGRDRADLDTDRQFSLAMVRLLEIVGEASRRVSESFSDQHPQVPWRDIGDLRNRLIHAYEQVNHDTLWDIVRLDLPPLVEQWQAILDERRGESA